MEKAYDIKDLAARAKNDGLNLAEEEVKSLIGHVCDWLDESAKLSPMPYDDMGLVVLPKVKELALGLADKIDGQVG